MNHRIVGTAGHIDHGKTALVRALTGVETDRLLEEKKRGITIELGFAPLDMGGRQTVGLVDVPGHERFIRHMLAGAGGIDAVLLVVAADESVKPQTREHFDICRLLGVRSGVIALSKRDLVDDELLELVRQEVAELVQGSFLEGAEMIPCSAVSGEGVDDVRQALARCLAALPEPRRPDFARLPVDRFFKMKGFGSVVTGTLLSGAIHLEDELLLLPEMAPQRVRRVQVHHAETETAEAGQRVALNLTSSGRDEPRRGDLLATPQRMPCSVLLDVRVEMLAGDGVGIRDQGRVRVHLGTADIEARLRILGARRTIQAGASAYAQLSLAREVSATPGDRLILRRPSPAMTLGGGEVLDPAPRRHRRRDGALEAWMRQLDESPSAARLQMLIDVAGQEGILVQDLVKRTGLSPQAVLQALQRNPANLQAGSGAGMAVLGAHAVSAMASTVQQLLSGFHRRHPLAAGMSVQEWRQRVAPHTPGPLVDALLHTLLRRGEVTQEGQHLALAGHRVQVNPAEEDAMAAVLEAIREQGLTPQSPVELMQQQGVTSARAGELVKLLLDREALVRIGDGLYLHPEAIDTLKSILQQRRRQEPLFDVAWFKDVTGTTRRIAIPLLEYLDAAHLTTRRGNARYIQATVDEA